MIDWNELKVEDVTYEVDAEGVQEMTGAVVFPLKVYGASGEFLFTHPVSLRTEFYEQLKTVTDWQAQLQTILKNRLKEELGRRRNRANVSIKEKLQLNKTPQSLKG